ncbi:DUF3139 domain-containing protein [Paenibacillus sp. Marseille-Q4541]|uniref:DUF3139 domain-containing protein n=1 Tax=Paenibacillus sp. Marseille-Q4541 TaxID=2831522 RepID=UPI001BA87952|nr:DUF3139 domain-containing protein [Paenibacillus sp. Marseille-Q4541]
MKRIILIGGGVFLGLVILVIGFIFFTVYSLNIPAKSDPELVTYNEERVKEFLIEERGYLESDIASIEVVKIKKTTDKTASGYLTYVEFSDEINKMYAYQLGDDGKVEQHGITGGAYKHKE